LKEREDKRKKMERDKKYVEKNDKPEEEKRTNGKRNRTKQLE
jgi:hypothetical protein